MMIDLTDVDLDIPAPMKSVFTIATFSFPKALKSFSMKHLPMNFWSFIKKGSASSTWDSGKEYHRICWMRSI